MSRVPCPVSRATSYAVQADLAAVLWGPRLPAPAVPSLGVAFCVARDGTSLRQCSRLKGSGGHPSSRVAPPPGGLGAAGLGWGPGHLCI